MPIYNTLSLRAVAVGVSVGVGLTVLYGVLGGVALRALGFTAAPTGLPTHLCTFMLGLAFTALGGSVAARKVSERPILHAAAVGALLVVVNAGMMLLMALFPIRVVWLSWSSVLSYTLTIPAAALGGWIVGRRDAHLVAG